MPAELNFFDTYTLMAVYKRVVPKKTFFRDRYSRPATRTSLRPTRF